MVSKARRAAWRTDVDGEASDEHSKSEIEFTNGIGGAIMRCGKALPRPSSKYRAALIANAFVGQALGQARAAGIAVSDCATVSMSSSEARNGMIVRWTCFDTSISKSGRLPPPSITSQPLRLLRLESRIRDRKSVV